VLSQNLFEESKQHRAGRDRVPTHLPRLKPGMSVMKFIYVSVYYKMRNKKSIIQCNFDHWCTCHTL